MSIFEYDEERHMQQERKEHFAAGRKEGIQGAVSLLKELDIPKQTIRIKLQKVCHLSPEETDKYL